MVLENLSFGFLKPNILDIKPRTVLYDDTAPPDKMARMEKAMRNTTSFETGVRLTGFQVTSLSCSILIRNATRTRSDSVDTLLLGLQ
jgi:1D-myo-inositol-tetrakisphosphate 5-kinase/inositol-polyphosphate multikinase